MCFFPEIVAALTVSHQARRIGRFSAELGGGDIFVLAHDKVPVAVFHPGVGAPLAVLHLERAIAAGAHAFVACGAAGVLKPGMALGHVIIPTAAVQDEGTSFHYAAPSRHTHTDPTSVAIASQVLHERAVRFALGTTWTTDAPYRETPARIHRRQREGCLTVEMETAAFLGVAAFRKVRFIQYLSDGERLQHLRLVLPCRVRVTATTHPLFGELLEASGFKRWNGVLLLVVGLLDGSPGTVRADATDVFAGDLVEPTRLVLDGGGLQALRALVTGLRRGPGPKRRGK